MSTLLSKVDRLMRKAGPVNTLVAVISERMLPSEVAHASGVGYFQCSTDRCGANYQRLVCGEGGCTPYDCLC